MTKTEQTGLVVLISFSLIAGGVWLFTDSLGAGLVVLGGLLLWIVAR